MSPVWLGEVLGQRKARASSVQIEMMKARCKKLGELYWDAIFDLTSQPHHARKAIAELKTSHAIYISSSSVYEDQSAVKVESDSLVPVLQSEAMNDVTQYPFAKVACESFYKAAFERVTIIRPSLIGGFGDVTGRSGYYPWRFMTPVGNHVVVPDTSFPVAMIDAVDLAQWILKCMRDAITGVFNASGKATSLSEVIEISKKNHPRYGTIPSIQR